MVRFLSNICCLFSCLLTRQPISSSQGLSGCLFAFSCSSLYPNHLYLFVCGPFCSTDPWHLFYFECSLLFLLTRLWSGLNLCLYVSPFVECQSVEVPFLSVPSSAALVKTHRDLFRHRQRKEWNKEREREREKEEPGLGFCTIKHKCINLCRMANLATYQLARSRYGICTIRQLAPSVDSCISNIIIIFQYSAWLVQNQKFVPFPGTYIFIVSDFLYDIGTWLEREYKQSGVERERERVCRQHW